MRFNEKLCMIYLVVALAIRPVYKYCEHMFDFPRINFTLIFVFLFLLLICINIYFFKTSIIEKYPISFLLLLLVSLIQIISFPWAVDYSSNGNHIYLTTISRTIIQYWLFWFVGIHIVKIFDNRLFWKIIYCLWFLTSLIIILNALSNIIFALILEGKNIYIMLGDSFAALSILVLCKTKKIKFQTFIIFISSVCLFALWSRASLYSFVIISLYLLYKKSKNLFLLFITIAISFIIYFVQEDIRTYRMTRILFGSDDLSSSMREDQLEIGLQDLSETWILGRFMGDVDKNFGLEGDYIHNYLSFWRQFGIVSFTIFCYVNLSNFIKLYSFIRNKKGRLNEIESFLFYFTLFCLIQIIVARSFVSSYVWLSMGAIPAYLHSFERRRS